jgi:hypothetical protein
VARAQLTHSLALDPAAAPIIERYLTELAAGLPCSGRARTAILAEVSDGLADSVAAHADSLPPAQAARAAVADFGEAPALACALSAELAGSTAHRVGLGLLLTGPLVGLAWLVAFVHGGGDWAAEVVRVLSWVPAYPLLLASVVPTAVLATVAGTGRATRWLPLQPRQAATAAAFAAAGCSALDAALLTHTAVAALTGTTLPPLAVAAAALSAARLCLVARAATRCLALRAAAREPV